MTFRLGCIPDLPDPRDLPFSAIRSALAPAIPLAASVDDPRVLIKDQTITSSCVGQAWAVGIRLAYLKAGVACPDLSALFLYRLARTLDGEDRDDGTYLRSAARVAMKLGAAREADFPFDAAKVNDAIGLGALHSGHDLRGIRGYYRIDTGDVDGVRLAIANGYPVVAGWDVDQTFMDWDGRRPIPGTLGRVLGGHALALYGYEEDGTFGFRNSWGIGWGRAGHGVATEAWVARARDVWAVDVEAI